MNSTLYSTPLKHLHNNDERWLSGRDSLNPRGRTRDEETPAITVFDRPSIQHSALNFGSDDFRKRADGLRFGLANAGAASTRRKYKRRRATHKYGERSAGILYRIDPEHRAG